MKYTIEGFSQSESIQLGLDIKDLVFLRWILDFFNTGSMEIHMFDGRHYFWLDYRKVLNELPILGISSKDVLARRMRHIEKCGVFEFMCFEGAGNKTYFRFNDAVLFRLLSDTNRQTGSFDNPKKRPTDLGGVPTQKSEGVPTQKSEGFLPKSRDHVDSSISDSSIKKHIAHSEIFEKLFSQYADKTEKSKARTAFNSTVKTGKDASDIVKAMANYKRHLSVNTWKRPQNGKTWFRNWKDWINYTPDAEPQTEKDKQNELDRSLYRGGVPITAKGRTASS